MDFLPPFDELDGWESADSNFRQRKRIFMVHAVRQRREMRGTKTNDDDDMAEMNNWKDWNDGTWKGLANKGYARGKEDNVFLSDNPPCPNAPS
jgi:hypothetical protein